MVSILRFNEEPSALDMVSLIGCLSSEPGGADTSVSLGVGAAGLKFEDALPPVSPADTRVSLTSEENK